MENAAQSKDSSTKVLIIGVGNMFRSDDAAGYIVADALRKKSLPLTTVIEESGEGAVLMDQWKDVEAVVLVDAVSSGNKPGSIHRFDAHENVIPARFFHYSSHAFSVAEAVEMARVMNRLPSKMIIYGIEGRNFQAGVGLSPEVQRSVPEVIQSIIDDVQNITSKGSTNE